VNANLRRLQQLEHSRSEYVAATDCTGARERLLAKISAMADRLRGDPNWEARPKPTLEEVKARLREAVARLRDQPVK
jgi:hypothetical protein